MIKVYEITSTAQDRITSFINTVEIILLICAAVYMLATLLSRIKDTVKMKAIKEIVQEFVKIVVVLVLITVLGAAIVSKHEKDETKLLNKDQYSLQIVDNKLIQLKKDDRKLKLTVQKNGDSKESDADVLEIVAETDEHYLCKANTSDRDTYVKVIKNEHNFVKESE